MNINKYKNLISHTYLFNNFTPDEVSLLFQDDYYQIKSYEDSSIIYLQNQICNNIDILLEGEVAIQKIDKEGKVLTITSFNAGDIMGGSLAFSKSNYYPMTVMTKSKSIVLHMEKDFIINLCQNNKEFLIKFLESLSGKNLILTDKINFMSMKSIRDKIIDFLTYEYYIQNNTTIDLTMSKKDLAEKFGVQRPSLFRELRKMKDEGIISYDHKHIEILDKNLFLNL